MTFGTDMEANMDTTQGPIDVRDANPTGVADNARLTHDGPASTADPLRRQNDPMVDQPAAPPIERWVPGRRVAIATVVSVIATIAPLAALALLGAPFGSDGIILAMLAVSGVAALLGTWAAVRWPRPTTWEAVGVRPASRAWLTVGAALGAATMLLNTGTIYLYGTLTGDQSIPVDRVAIVEALGGPLWQSLLMLALGVLLVPLGEELIFRGVIFGWMRRWPLPIAVIVSALVFAVMHGFSVVFPVALVLGIVTAMIYHRSGSIWPAVMLHAVNNGIAFGVSLLSG